MTIFVLRHGLAVEPGTRGYHHDPDRPLTDEGRSKLRRIAKAMNKLELEFELILSSPYTRARQTAEIVADRFGAKKQLEFSNTLTPEGGTMQVVELLQRRKPQVESVLLVGHEPSLSLLIGFLASGEGKTSILLKKGGLAKLTTGRLHHGRCAVLEWLLTPKQLVLLGE